MSVGFLHLGYLAQPDLAVLSQLGDCEVLVLKSILQ